MSSNEERHPQLNRARRHFLGLAAASGARIAAMGSFAATVFSSSGAQAKGRKWWKKDTKPGGGTMCFLRGTAIMTPTGEVCVEDLQIGDRVKTVRGEALAVKWIGRHVYKKTGPSWNEGVVPIRISQHALDHQTPHRDLFLSPAHALFMGGVLVRAKDLVNGLSIAPALTDRDMFEYFHVVLDTHEVILAEGAPAETFLVETHNYEEFTNFVEYPRLYPADKGQVMKPFAPIVGRDSGREHLKALLPQGVRRAFQMRELVENIHERLAARAVQLMRHS